MKLISNGIFRHNRIRNGDIQAFETLFKLHYAPLCRFAMRFVNDKDVAEEIVQEFFYNYWKNRADTIIRSSIKSYLYKSIKNNALKYLDQLAVRKKYAETILATVSDQYQSTIAEEMDARELKRIIDTALEDLPERTRQIFRMNRIEGLKYQEIADRLSISVKTVEANMSRSLRVLRDKLKQYHAENSI